MLNTRFAKDYIVHQFKSKTRHGTHSPFVYRLVDEVIYDFRNKKLYSELESLRRELLSDERLINVTKFGAGSRRNNKPRKKVSDIAGMALSRPKMAQLLHRLVSDLKPKNMIELGTSLGITSLYLQKAAPDAVLSTLEGCPETIGIATDLFKNAGTHINQVIGDFDDTLPGVIADIDKLDFAFVDGNHQKEATLRYFEWLLPKVHEGTLLVFDDIYWSEGMKEAWNEIKAHPRVTVTIDLFWFGLVYFKKGQAKEDFLIRI